MTPPNHGLDSQQVQPLAQQITSCAPVAVIGLYRQSKLDALCRSPAMLGPHAFRKPVAVAGARMELAAVHTIADVARGWA